MVTKLPRALWLMCLTLLLASGYAQALRADDNPYKRSEVGDWVSYKSEVQLPNGQKVSTTLKQIVKAKDDKEVTIAIETQSGNMKLPAREIKVRLDQPYDPATSIRQMGGNNKAEKIDEGTETVKIDNQFYPCQWVKMKISVDAAGQKFETTSKVWTSKEIPVGGLVKMETEVAGQKVVMLLTGHGKKK